ncbi:sunset domain-containing protein, partial [Companilactobacillus hulinensis]|uniref:sunset domain-containing protein n=1 Tax=Companilactobacillus hulinensis TaxID=2486007 RepID=UPI001781FF80
IPDFFVLVFFLFSFSQVANLIIKFATNKLSNIYELKNNEFIKITDRALAKRSPWAFNKTVKGSNGLTYYRVATNEWLPSDHIKSIEIFDYDSSKKVITIGNWNAVTVDPSGHRTNNILNAHSTWKALPDIVYINGQTYYQISPDEFVSTYDVYTPGPQTENTNVQNNDGKIIGNSQSKVYHTPDQKNYTISDKHRVVFNSEEEAIAAGYHKSKR